MKELISLWLSKGTRSPPKDAKLNHSIRYVRRSFKRSIGHTPVRLLSLSLVRTPLSLCVSQSRYPPSSVWHSHPRQPHSGSVWWSPSLPLTLTLSLGLALLSAHAVSVSSTEVVKTVHSLSLSLCLLCLSLLV